MMMQVKLLALLAVVVAQSTAKEYKLDIDTAKLPKWSTTNANVKVKLVGECGESEEFSIGTPKNSFQRGSSDSFTLSPNSCIGNLKSVKVSHDGTGKWPGWVIEKITITPEDGQALLLNDGPATLHAKGAASADFSIPNYEEVKMEYKLDIDTAKLPKWSTTNANVKVKLVGECGESEAFSIGTPKKSFQRGSSDSFTLSPDSCIGDLKSVKVSHDGTGKWPGWVIEKITITVNGKTMRLNDSPVTLGAVGSRMAQLSVLN